MSGALVGDCFPTATRNGPVYAQSSWAAARSLTPPPAASLPDTPDALCPSDTPSLLSGNAPCTSCSFCPPGSSLSSCPSRSLQRKAPRDGHENQPYLLSCWFCHTYCHLTDYTLVYCSPLPTGRCALRAGTCMVRAPSTQVR